MPLSLALYVIESDNLKLKLILIIANVPCIALLLAAIMHRFQIDDKRVYVASSLINIEFVFLLSMIVLSIVILMIAIVFIGRKQGKKALIASGLFIEYWVVIVGAVIIDMPTLLHIT